VGPGTLVADRFEVVRALARGGMADLYEAIDKTTDERVALKVLREELSKDPEVLTRFHREARAAGAIRDPNVAEVFECGTTERNRPFIVMELLEGNDLARELDMRGVLPADEAVKLIIEACQGMIAAHEAGIVHRDLKPSNLFLAHHGGRRVLKVLDFGISKFVAAADENVTLTKALFGSPLYMSPEQFRSAKAADHRSDVWSLGVIFYELLTGLPPFVAENAPAVGLAITKDPHLPPSERRPSLSRSIDTVIAGALQKNPAHRYQTMKELLRALEDLVPRSRDDTPTRLNALTPAALAAASGSVRPPVVAARPQSSKPPSPPIIADPTTQMAATIDEPPSSLELTHDLTRAVPTQPSVPSPAAPSSPPPLEVDASRGSEPRSFALSNPSGTTGGGTTSQPPLSYAPPMRKRDGRLLWAALGGIVVIGIGAFLASRGPATPAPPADTGPAVGASTAAPSPTTAVPARPALPPGASPTPAPSASETFETEPAAGASATDVDELPPASTGKGKSKTGKSNTGKPKGGGGLYHPSGI
jgi:serine/threonine protein kinase